MRHQEEHGGLWRNTVAVCCGAFLLLFSAAVQAASLQQIEVASALGQPLYAEVPLTLDGNELASKVFIDIASAADYKIFEVYRDPVLDHIRADVASDKRGVRVKLTSRIAIPTPFFNLVLKIRYGRVSHFKKFAVFLDSAQSIERIVEQTALPKVQAIVPVVTADTVEQSNSSSASNASQLTASAGKALVSEQDMQAAKQQLEVSKSGSKKHEGWARTAKYGPIVRGDSLSIVAQRLRTDYRYSINQVMVALFERNNASFQQDNMNLIKVESFLQAPTAAEIEKHSRSEAFRISAEHEQAWRQQPRYAVEAETQRQRYSNRVSVGEQADGVAVTATNKSVQTAPRLSELVESVTVASVETNIAETDALESAKPVTSPQSISPQLEQLIQAQNETNALLLALQQKNSELQEQLMDNKNSVDALNSKIDEGTTAASNARVAKLEILLTRLQAELEKRAQQPAAQAGGSADWVTWILLSLLIVMLGVIAMLMRKEPDHPSSALASLTAAVQPDKQDAAELAESSPKAESLADVVEEEVENIETNEHEASIATATGTFDAMASFSDELSDTDTAELEPFDVDVKQELDPNVDYLSEADVYIRYGMDDEALQQLDMALRLNPDNTDAHIKKAEMLHGKQDKRVFAAAVSAATIALAATELDRYNSSIAGFVDDLDKIADEPDDEADVLGDVETTPVTVMLDDVGMEDFDFDLQYLDVAGTDSNIEIAAHVDVEHDAEDATQDPAESAAVEEPDALDWLSDPAFDDAQQSVAADVSEAANESNSVELQTTGSATQQLGSLLGEFSGEDISQVKSNKDVLNTDENSFDAQSVVTQDLDSLLSDFTEQDDAGLSPLDASVADSSGEDADDGGAAQRLDNLLGEFADDDDNDLDFSGKESFDDAVTGQATAAAMDSGDADDTIGIGTDYGATQELDSLLSEFSDEDDGLSFVEAVDVATTTQEQSLTTSKLDHGATQELDSLLSEFSEAEHAAATSDDIDQGATQVLGHLLNEFSDDDVESDEGDKAEGDKKS